MSTLFWISILIIVVTVFIFVIVPWAGQPIIEIKPTTQVAAAAAPAAPTGPVVDHLAQFYKPAQDCVAEDHPRREIGACPESKAMSSALPITNVPLCVARQGDNMLLGGPLDRPLSVSV